MSMSRLKDVLLIAAGAVVTLATLIFALKSRVLKASDFEVVSGSSASVSVGQSVGEPFADLYLSGDSIRYRVPIEMFKELKNPKAFVRAAAVPGQRVRFHVERGAQAHPYEPRTDHKPTVAVESISIDDVEYYSLAERMEWLRSNRMWLWVISPIFALLTAYLAFHLRADLRKAKTTVAPLSA